jgi:hypothetical protein
MQIKTALSVALISFLLGCNQPSGNIADRKGESWKERFDKELPLLGHRNWVLVVDKAFPMQTSPGMEVVNTNEKLLPVLDYTLHQMRSSSHVKPIIYVDKEIKFITEDAARGVNSYKAGLKKILGDETPESILHDSVFVKLDAASRLFKIFILKTNEVIPYSSVFLQLDCAYWNAASEKHLRDSMNAAR